MSSFSLFHTAGSALTAQSVRLNTVSSNLANADVVAGSADEAYRPKQAVFESDPTNGGVRVSNVENSNAEVEKRYQPGHPLADPDGYVYAPGVNAVEEMANMISAARSYQSNLEVMNTAKDLMMRTLNLGR